MIPPNNFASVVYIGSTKTIYGVSGDDKPLEVMLTENDITQGETPLTNNHISNWNAYESLLKHCINQVHQHQKDLGISLEVISFPLLVIIRSYDVFEELVEITDKVFSNYSKLPAILYLHYSIAELLAHNLTSGIVVEFDTQTTILPVINGTPLVEFQKQLNFVDGHYDSLKGEILEVLSNLPENMRPETQNQILLCGVNFQENFKSELENLFAIDSEIKFSIYSTTQPEINAWVAASRLVVTKGVIFEDGNKFWTKHSDFSNTVGAIKEKQRKLERMISESQGNFSDPLTYPTCQVCDKIDVKGYCDTEHEMYLCGEVCFENSHPKSEEDEEVAKPKHVYKKFYISDDEIKEDKDQLKSRVKGAFAKKF